MVQKYAAMESMAVTEEYHSNEMKNANGNVDANDCSVHQDVVKPERELEIMNVDTPITTKTSSNQILVMPEQSHSNFSPQPPDPESEVKTNDEGKEDGTDITVDPGLNESMQTNSTIPNNAFEATNKLISTDLNSKHNNEEDGFKLGFNNDESTDVMCVENIEDDHVGRMVHSREPLSIIAEGNSPVAEVAPLIVINRPPASHFPELRKTEDNVRPSISTVKSDLNIMKSEIILPSKSKIPQGIRGIKRLPGCNRMYLQGLKKSTSLNSPLSSADLSPNIYRLAQDDVMGNKIEYDDDELSVISTPMSVLSEVADGRSKSNFIYIHIQNLQLNFSFLVLLRCFIFIRIIFL